MNLHGIATASPSSWCVCQFRHHRKGETPQSKIRPHRVKRPAPRKGTDFTAMPARGRLNFKLQCVLVLGGVLGALAGHEAARDSVERKLYVGAGFVVGSLAAVFFLRAIG